MQFDGGGYLEWIIRGDSLVDRGDGDIDIRRFRYSVGGNIRDSEIQFRRRFARPEAMVETAALASHHADSRSVGIFGTRGTGPAADCDWRPRADRSRVVPSGTARIGNRDRKAGIPAGLPRS